MLVLTRETGQTIFIGRWLAMSDLPGTAEYQIDFDRVDHRIRTRGFTVTISGPDGIQTQTLSPDSPDFDFAEGYRLAFLGTHEYAKKDAGMVSVARVGIAAPREQHIVREDTNPISAINKGCGR